MVQIHSRTPQDYPQWVSTVLAHTGNYGIVSRLSQQVGVARQTLYRWKAKGQAALQAAFTPAAQGADDACPLERAILMLLVEGHASYRGIQRCLWTLLGQQVSLGTITSVVQRAEKLAQQWMSQHAPASLRALALDELYGRLHGQAYQSAGRCAQRSRLGQHQSRGGRCRELDAGVVAAGGARHSMANGRQ